jgi:hypothetical protein
MIVGVMAPIGLDGLSQGLHRGSYPIVGRTVHVSCQAVSSWWSPYRPSPSWAVLSCLSYVAQG